MNKRIAYAAAGVVVGALALAYYGRSRARVALAPLGEPDASEVVASMTFTDALRAGARAVAGMPVFAKTTVEVTQ
jgi:hypothetical protein